jgi:WD40 repeat protein
MSDAPQLPAKREFALGAYVSGAAFSADGETAAFALGSGTVKLVTVADNSTRDVAAHKGAILSFAPHPDGVSFVSGGDDGRLLRVGVDGSVAEIGKAQGRWIDALATHKSGGIACGIGKEIWYWAPGATEPKKLGPHPSTIAALDFSPDGSRVAGAHYGGASIWQVRNPASAPRKMDWKGSHLAIKYAPSGKFLATTTQDNAIHVWRLTNGQDMQMAGYRTKVKFLAWTANARFLLSDAADCFVCWDFSGKGPEGQPPVEYGFGDGAGMTAIVAHPDSPFVCGGFENGGLRLGDMDSRRDLELRAPEEAHKPIRAMAWSQDGWRIAAGAEDGYAVLFDLKNKS